jgi:hypothetical protein
VGKILGAAIAVLAGAGAGHAGPTDAFAPSLVLDRSHFALGLGVEANLAPLLVGSPTSLAPDFWYGVTPELTLGVIHSDASIDRVPVFFEPGETICIRLEQISCPRRYHGSGLDGLYEVQRGALEVALHARVLLRDVDPIKPAITLGATLRWQHRWLAIVGDPFVQLGLVHTDAGNRAELWLPVTLAVAPLALLSFELRTGYNADFAVWNDGYYVPLFARIRARASHELDVGAGIGFASLVGTQNNPRERMMAVDVTWRD